MDQFIFYLILLCSALGIVTFISLCSSIVTFLKLPEKPAEEWVTSVLES